MVILSRRAALLGAASLPFAARAAGAVELTWNDLLPADDKLAKAVRSMEPVDHSDPMAVAGQPPSSGVIARWNGQRVRISGFAVPLDYDGFRVRNFILAPFRGACIHVPPPPANQLVMVTAAEPLELRDPNAAVTVTGTFSTSVLHTSLAEVGYVMEAEAVERRRA